MRLRLKLAVTAATALGPGTFAWLRTAQFTDLPGWAAVPISWGMDLLPFFLLAWAGCVLSAAGLLLAGLVLRERRELAPLCLVALSGAALSVLLMGPGEEARQQALLTIAERAKPLASAVEQFCGERGHYPEELLELTPQYLRSIPKTGASAYPIYVLRSLTQDERIPSYELAVHVGFGMCSDVYFYWPEGDYPERIYGGVVERIGEWAYVHE